jgi:thymidylate synthase (FAD)
MKNIEVKILNPEVVANAEKMMVCGARLTQRGHNVHNMDDFLALYNKDYQKSTARAMANLPHDTIKRFGVINIAIVGASRRFLAQITRHQAGVTFISASLQYSNYSGNADFVVPYEILKNGEFEVNRYIDTCKEQMAEYEHTVQMGIDHDAAGYIAPQGLRNVLIISANPVALQHMIGIRTCRRNTLETRYVMLKIWEELYKLSPEMFGKSGPFCMNGPCKEGNMCCGKPINKAWSPMDIIKADFPLLIEEDSADEN